MLHTAPRPSFQRVDTPLSDDHPLDVEMTSDLDKYALWDTYRRLSDYFRPYLFRTLLALGLTFPIGAMDGAIVYALKPLVDGAYHGTNQLDLSLVPFAIVGFTLVQGFLNYISIYMDGWLGAKVMIGLQKDLFQKLQTLDMRFFDLSSTGWVLQRFFRDPEAIQANILNNTKKMLTRLFSSVFLCGVMLTISWKLALIAITILLMALFPVTQIRKIIRKISEDTTSASSELLSFYTDTVAGSRVIFGYNLQHVRRKQYDKLQEQMFVKRIKRTQAQGWLTPVMHVISAIGIAIIIWQGSGMILSGELTKGGFVSFLGAMLMLYNPIKNLGPSMMGAHLSLLAARRIFMLLDKQLVILEKPDAIRLKEVNYGIRFENVSFYYDPSQADKPILKNINLTFRKGKLTALVGPSGGGKTTLVNLIPRFYEAIEGTVTIDNQNIRNLTQESLRNNIAIVFQDNYFFNSTIYDNLLVGKPQASQKEVWEALEKAYLGDFVKQLPKGIQTEIGERGYLLSGGQRQRLAIARAILKNAPIIILDEATSALDNHAEAIVHKAIESLIEDKTVIVIAHRLSTIRNADHIILLDQGQVAEEGKHLELLKADGLYASMYKTQFDSKHFQFEDLIESQGNLKVVGAP